MAHFDADIISDSVTADEFRAAGVVWHRTGDAWLVVVDPLRHPFGVWRRRDAAARSYAASARALDAAVFTNGPMMGRRVWPGVKLTRRLIAAELGLAAAAGALAGGAVGPRVRSAPSGPALGAAVGATLMASGVWGRAFRGWESCGRVRSGSPEVPEVDHSFDGEGPDHSWIGRSAAGFSGLQIGYGDLPDGIAEGLGGLLMLVHDAKLATRPPRPGTGRDLAALGAKTGIVAWGLVPLHLAGGIGDDGVIAILASRAMDAYTAARVLIRIGARSAVGTDQRGAVMLGSGRSCLITPPRHRQSMQAYGLCCR